MNVFQVFVGGLPYHTSDQSLREFFSTFGEIEEAVVIHDRATGKSKGYGFVSAFEIKSLLSFSIAKRINSIKLTSIDINLSQKMVKILDSKVPSKIECNKS